MSGKAGRLLAALRGLGGREGRVYRAPGRVNLIGEHTDYSEGFVMPIALGLQAWVAAAGREDRILRVRSEAFGEDVALALDAPLPRPAGHWSNYVLGIAACLERTGLRLRGADLLIDSDVPFGAGLSSSAALLAAVGYALLDTSGHSIDRLGLARACQQAEHDFAGTRCGIMDPFVSLHGRVGHALLLDCRSLAVRFLPLPADVRLIVCNTMVRHELASGEYNARRADCEAAVAQLARTLPGVGTLRDVSLDQLEGARAGLPERLYRRCRHVVGENDRVLRAAAALEARDPHSYGRLMGASHESLRTDYEVSCPELDLMVGLAQETPGVLGSRMTGGGFGGCTVSLVEADRAEAIRDQIAESYERATGRKPDTWVSLPGDGAGPVSDASEARGSAA